MQTVKEPGAPAAPQPASEGETPGLSMEPSAGSGRPADLSAEAARAVAQARAAAAARLREAARAAAQKEPGSVVTAKPAAPARKAKPGLQELPSVAGEVEATPKEPPPIQKAQIVVSLESPPGGSPPVQPIVQPAADPNPPAAQPAAAGPPPAPSQKSPLEGATQLLQVTKRLQDRTTEKTRQLPLSARPTEGLPGPRWAQRLKDPEADRRTELVEVLDPGEPPPARSLMSGILVIAVAAAAVISLSLRPILALRNTSRHPAQVTSQAEPAQLLGRIDRSMDVEDWHTALLLCTEGLKAHPDSTALQDRRRRVEAEMRSQFRYDSYRAAASRHNDEAALALFAELPDDSVYKAKAAKEAQEIRDTYIATRLAEARTARRLNLCKEVHRLSRAILSVDDRNEEARTLDGRCTAETRPRKAKDSADDTANGRLRNPFQ